MAGDARPPYKTATLLIEDCTMARRWLALAAALLLLSAPVIARAQDAAGAFTPAQRAEIVRIMREAMKQDPSILRDAVTALQADEARLQEAAARQAIGRAGPVLSRKPGDPVAGDPAGDVTLVEFYDVRCPYCRGMLATEASLLAENPKLRLVFKDIPILGPPSVLGAKAVLAAQYQGGYLKMREAVMKGPQQITEDTLHAAAAASGLDWARLRRDMDNPDIQTRINANLKLAHDLGVEGTPAYVVGTKMFEGAISLQDLQNAVTQARG